MLHTLAKFAHISRLSERGAEREREGDQRDMWTLR